MVNGAGAMMNCEVIRDNLTKYLLGDLDEVATQRVREHLKVCEDCRAEAWDIKPTLDTLRDALAVPTAAPRRLSGERHQALIHRHGSRSTRIDWWLTRRHKTLSLAAAALIMIVVVFAMFMRTSLRSERLGAANIRYMGKYKSEYGSAPLASPALEDRGEALELGAVDEITEMHEEPPEGASIGGTFSVEASDGIHPLFFRKEDEDESLKGRTSGLGERLRYRAEGEEEEQDGRSHIGRQGMSSGETTAGSGQIAEPSKNKMVPIEINLPKAIFRGTPMVIKPPLPAQKPSSAETSTPAGPDDSAVVSGDVNGFYERLLPDPDETDRSWKKDGDAKSVGAVDEYGGQGTWHFGTDKGLLWSDTDVAGKNISGNIDAIAVNGGNAALLLQPGTKPARAPEKVRVRVGAGDETFVISGIKVQLTSESRDKSRKGKEKKEADSPEEMVTKFYNVLPSAGERIETTHAERSHGDFIAMGVGDGPGGLASEKAVREGRRDGKPDSHSYLQYRTSLTPEGKTEEKEFSERKASTRESMLEVRKDLQVFMELNAGNELNEDVSSVFETGAVPVDERRIQDPIQKGQVLLDGEADTKGTGGGKLAFTKGVSFGITSGAMRMDSTEEDPGEGMYAKASMQNDRAESLKTAAHHLRRAADRDANGDIEQKKKHKKRAIAALRRARTELEAGTSTILDTEDSGSRVAGKAGGKTAEEYKWNTTPTDVNNLVSDLKESVDVSYHMRISEPVSGKERGGAPLEKRLREKDSGNIRLGLDLNGRDSDTDGSTDGTEVSLGRPVKQVDTTLEGQLREPADDGKGDKDSGGVILGDIPLLGRLFKSRSSRTAAPPQVSVNAPESTQPRAGSVTVETDDDGLTDGWERHSSETRPLNQEAAGRRANDLKRREHRLEKVERMKDLLTEAEQELRVDNDADHLVIYEEVADENRETEVVSANVVGYMMMENALYIDIPNPSPPADFSPQPAKFDSVAMVKSPVIMRNIYGSRLPGVRGKAMAEYGGSGESEGSVMRSLRYLKEKQNQDGSWGNDVSDTSVSLLAMLAHGETPSSREFGSTTERAMKHLVDAQREDGRFSDDLDENAKAAHALAEAYGLTRVPMLKDAAEKAVAAVIEDNRTRVDMSGWEASALKSAQLAGLEVNDLSGAIQNGTDKLKRSDTPAAVLGLQYFGKATDEATRRKLKKLEVPAVTAKGSGGFEDFYFQHQARFNEGGKTWSSWNRAVAPELVQKQVVQKQAGQNGKDIGYYDAAVGENQEADRIYNTAIASLMGSTYYRYLPTFKPTPEDSEELEIVADDIEVTIDFATIGEGVKDEDLASPRFKAVGINPFFDVSEKPFSTFGIDVDTASYTLMRNTVNHGKLPAAESVRTEEFVNFFDYAYTPAKQKTFRIYTEAAPSKFGRGLHMLKIGVKGKRLGREEQRKAALTFLIDTSGSMDQPDRVGLVKKSLKMLVGKLNSTDEVAIVQYSSAARVVIEHTPVSKIEQILKAIDQMQCGGSTNLEKGMGKAYELAASSFANGGENRVLLLSDGVANLGTGSAETILASVEKYRKQGIFCSVFGFGSGTYDDEMLETLANKGDGSYAFIDSETEAKRVFVDDLSATLNTIASDVKIQVEFKKDAITRYRQLGYENRQLTKQQFRDDTVDAGEVGSGQAVTALYEMQLAADHGPRTTDHLDQIVAVVRVRYRRTDNGKVEEIEQPVKLSQILSSFDEADNRFKLAACVAEYAEILRGCPHSVGSTYQNVSEALTPVALDLNLDTRVQELLRMINQAGGLPRTQ